MRCSASQRVLPTPLVLPQRNGDPPQALPRKAHKKGPGKWSASLLAIQIPDPFSVRLLKTTQLKNWFSGGFQGGAFKNRLPNVSPHQGFLYHPGSAPPF